MAGEVTKELRKIYARAAKQGIWIREFGPPQGCRGYTATAGGMKQLETLEQKVGREIDVYEFSLGDIFKYTNALLGMGDTREEACRDAIKEYKAYQRLHE